ncbi:hypothetical protein [Hanstruepera ponticola]|uniref:hypothetical protein n=1 Tax=Hanstruepera ponticola TaxID=2042995 RepID=UPI000CF0C246|nr:hypothetical protein [Hanstruepera ponticola]
MAKSNRNFNYKPRFQDDAAKDNNANIKTEWQNLKHSRSRKKSFLSSPLFLVLFLITVLIIMYVLSQYE